MKGYYITKISYFKTKGEDLTDAYSGKKIKTEAGKDAMLIEAHNDKGLFRQMALHLEGRTPEEMCEDINDIIAIFSGITPEVDGNARKTELNGSQ